MKEDENTDITTAEIVFSVSNYNNFIDVISKTEAML